VAAAALAALLGSGLWLAFASASSDWIVDTASASEPGWLRGPLAGILPGLTDPSFSALMLVMLGGYAGVVALVAVFGLAPVVLSSDLFGYVAYARLDAVHGLNPYLHGAIAAPGDPILPYVYWRHASSPYGPLYTLLTLPAGRLGLPAAVWSLKSLSTFAALAGVALIARVAPAYGQAPGRAALFIAGNPLLLAYAVGGGHNDLLVLAVEGATILILGPAGRSGRRAASGGGALVVALAFKVTGGLLLPFAWLGSGARRRFAAGTAAALGAAAALTLVAFGERVPAQIGRIATSQDFVTAYSGPDALGRLLGTGVTSGVRLACALCAGGVAVACLWRVHRGADWLAAASITGVAALCAIPSLVPWYVLWVLPAPALARGRATRPLVLGLTAAMLVTRLPILGFDAY
jgi:hypothetical protein